MTLQERFAKLVESLFEVKDQTPPTEQGGLIVRYRARIYHVGLNVARKELTTSTAVFFSFMQGADLYPDMVGDFNAYHLLNGGYRMNVDRQTHALYVSQTKLVDRLERIGFAAYLEDFAARCATCAQWCLEEVGKRPAPELDLTKLDFSGIDGLTELRADEAVEPIGAA
jgi:hypothetical protein